MAQLTIPGVPRPSAADPLDPGPEPAPEPAEEDPRQLVLFSDAAVLGRELDAALLDGDFEHADGVRQQIEQTFGPGAAAPHLFLAPLATGFRSGRVEEALSAWCTASASLSSRPGFGRRVRHATFRRAAATWGGERVAAAAPQHLADIANAIAGEPGGRAAARRLVRDALLQGRELLPLGFEDPAVCDVLAEDRSPVWLACLGAVRRVWPVTARTRCGPGGAVAGPPPGGGQARRFWYWLQVAEAPGGTREDAYEARKHLKRLDRELHALYMRGAPARVL